MTVVDVEESTPESEAAAAGTRWGRWALVALSLFVVYLVADIAVKPAISPMLVAGVSKAELEAAAVAEFQVQYDAINLGTPTAPFATSSQAADWAEHSKAVVTNFAEITAAIKSGDREPVKVHLDSVGWVPAWNTPVLKMRVSIHDPAIKAGSWSGDEASPWSHHASRPRRLSYYPRHSAQLADSRRSSITVIGSAPHPRRWRREML